MVSDFQICFSRLALAMKICNNSNITLEVENIEIFRIVASQLLIKSLLFSVPYRLEKIISKYNEELEK